MILASQSPRRIELMRKAGYDVHVIPADIDETPLPAEEPTALVERLARAKAEAVAQTAAAPGEIVLAADTIVALDGATLGKPADAADAHAMLRRLSGRTHQVATGVCVARGAATEAAPETASEIAPEVIASFVEVTDVTFYELTNEEIDRYVASGEPLDKAGAYGIQGVGGRLLVKKIDGDFYNVVGLPIARVVRILNSMSSENPPSDNPPSENG